MSTKTAVFSASMHMVEPVKNPMLTHTLVSVLTGTDLIELVLQSNVKSMPNRMQDMFSYAESSYTLALPEGAKSTFRTPSAEDIASAITTDISHPDGVVILQSIYGTYQAYFDILDHLLATGRGVNPINNTISNYPGLSTSNGELLKIVNSAISSDELTVTLYYEYFGYVTTEVLINDVWTTQASLELLGNPTETIIRSAPNNIILQDKCLIVSYQKLDNLGIPLAGTYYWIYRVSSNLYPALDNAIRTMTADKYYPVVPIRYNNVDLTDVSVQGTDLFKTSKELLNILNIPIEDVGNSINDSPNKEAIDNAYIMFGADLQTDDSATLAYYNHYFYYLFTLGITFYEAKAFWDTTPSDQDFIEYGLNLSLGFTNITVTYLPGKVNDGTIGNARKTIVLDRGSGNDITTSYVLFDLQTSSHTYRRVQVDNLTAISTIDSQWNYITRLEHLVDDPDKHSFVLPLEYNTVNLLPYEQRITLYSSCLLMTITTIDHVKLKWYQEHWFQGVIFAIVIIIIMYTGQYWLLGLTSAATTGAGIAIAAGMSALVGATIGVLLYIGASIAGSYLLSRLAKWTVRKYGAKMGIIGAVVLTIIALIATQGRYGSEILTQYILQTAQIALMFANAVIQASKELIATATQNIIDAYEVFTDLLAKAKEELELNEEIKSLSFESEFDLFAIHKMRGYTFIPNEYPEAFFDRTLRLPYSTTYGIHEAVPNFVDRLLTINSNTVKLAY